MVVRQQLCSVRLCLKNRLLFNSDHCYHPWKGVFQSTRPSKLQTHQWHQIFVHVVVGLSRLLSEGAGRRDSLDRACCGKSRI